MKQEAKSYLETIKSDLENISNFILNNPEEPFNEVKCSNYITNYLKSINFSIVAPYLGMNTSFMASIGNGHPKICLLCEYDAFNKDGHVDGNHLLSEITIGAAAALSKVISKFKSGTITVIGCPGESKKSSSITLVKQGAFEDIDACFMVRPYIYTAESGKSSALLPINISFKNNFESKETNCYSPLDACLFTFNGLNTMIKGFKSGCFLDSLEISGKNMAEASGINAELAIRAFKLCDAENIINKLQVFLCSVGQFLNTSIELKTTQISYEELHTNETLSRLFSHNLKESGIINIKETYDLKAHLGMGTISKAVPFIYPFVGITKRNDLTFRSVEFLKETKTEYAKEIVFKAIEALTNTIIDILEKDSLLKETLNDFSLISEKS